MHQFKKKAAKSVIKVCIEELFNLYFILSSEINAYLKQIKMVFSQSEMI